MKRLFVSFLTACALAGIMLLNTGCAEISRMILPEEKISLSFYDAPAPAIADYLSQLTDLPVSLDPAIEELTITLVTTSPATHTEVEKLIVAAFEAQDCRVIREKNSITIRKIP